MKYINKIIPTLLIIVGIILIFGQLEEFVLLTFIAIKVVGLSAIMIALEILSGELEMNTKQDERFDLTTGIFYGVSLFILIVLFIGSMF